MEQSDRDRIQRNLVHLCKLVNVRQVSDVLIESGIIDHEFVERIQHYPTESQRNQEFFLLYTKRGPLAFSTLVQALKDTGHISEAQLLAGSQETSTPPSPRHQTPNSKQCLRVAGRSSSLESPSESESVSSSEGNGGGPPNLESSESSWASTSLSSERGGGGDTKELEKCLPTPTTSGPPNTSPSQALRALNISEANIPTPPLSPSPINITPIKTATKYNQGKTSDEEAYPMMAKPRGYALIMNNIDFPSNPDERRNGAEYDSENLKRLCEGLGFHTTVRHNVTKNDLRNPNDGILKKFCNQFRGPSIVDACIVAIMSHGTESRIRTSDPGDTYVDLYDDIIRPFNNQHCRQLIRKPKIFIVQACRGDSRDRGTRRTESDGRSLTQTPPPRYESASAYQTNGVADACLLPSFEDILVCYSTVPGFVANRDTQRGTWYIQCLVEAFREHAHELEIHALLRKVGIKMRAVNNEFGDEKQMSCFKNIGFHRELYFNPGMFVNDTSPDEVLQVQE